MSIGKSCCFVAVFLLIVQLFAFPVKPEIYRMAQVDLTGNFLQVVADESNTSVFGVTHMFVFSAQNPKDNTFDLHCRHVSADEVSSLFGQYCASNCVGDVLAKDITCALLSQSNCFDGVLIMDCAKGFDSIGRPNHFSMYLLRQKGKKYEVTSFSEKANVAKLFKHPVVESRFVSRASLTNSIANLLVYICETNRCSMPKWTLINAQVDLNTMRKISELELNAYERETPRGIGL